MIYRLSISARDFMTQFSIEHPTVISNIEKHQNRGTAKGISDIFMAEIDKLV